jgi:hypothetical protein
MHEELSASLKDLAQLHPTYSRLELEEAHAQLFSYFDLVWRIFMRLEREGKLDALNLTKKSINPTFNAPTHQ